MESEIARLTTWWKMIFFFCIHVWYNLPKIVRQGTPPPQRIEMLEPLKMESDLARLPEWRRWFFSITFMFSPIYLRLGDVPPPPELNLDLIWDEPGQWGQWVHFRIYLSPPHLPSTWCYAWEGNLWISISGGYLKVRMRVSVTFDFLSFFL